MSPSENAPLYGEQTRLALENFPFAGRRLGQEPAFVRAFAKIKAAAAIANCELNLISTARSHAIVEAAKAMADGRLNAHLVVPMLEGSGGTSLNMNVNEVLARSGAQLADFAARGEPDLHPNDDINRSQSTNDVTPTALKLACWEMLNETLAALASLRAAFAERALAFSDHLKLGRTCLQDAQPMTLGQSFGAYATLADRLCATLAQRRNELLDLPLGATAIGVGFGAPPGYRERVFAALSELVGTQVRPTPDLFDGLSNADTYARLSGELRTAGLALAKIANDLMILSSGPNGGLAELTLPETQAGSSIMPGKVNPVIPMAVCQVGFALCGYDVAIAAACQQGQLEINPYEPLIAAQLFESIRLLTTAAQIFATRCIAGIQADRARMESAVLKSSAVATALSPLLGYAAVAELVKRSQEAGVTFIDLVDAEGVMSREQLVALVRDSARGHK